MTLATAPPAAPLRVVRLVDDHATLQRLVELGLHTGARLRVLSGTGQEPLLLELYGSRVAVSLDLARCVEVAGDPVADDLSGTGRRRRRRRRTRGRQEGDER